MTAKGVALVAVVTGATEGIGKQTAIELAKKGLFVVVHGRSESRARQAADAIGEASKSDAIDIAVADFASMKEARAMGDPSLEKTTGKYFSDARESQSSARSRDEKLARAFYEKSSEVTRTKPLPENAA